MMNKIEKKFGDITVVQRTDNKWGVVDAQGHEIVPFGTYDWIDTFDQGLARVKIGKFARDTNDSDQKWGIINTAGEIVLPIEYDEIWKFAGKDRYSTKTIKGGIEKEVYFHDLNPDLPVHVARYTNDYYEPDDDYEEHYEEYAGSYAQDVMGYSDEAINDAFDGDPVAYWNID